MGGKQDWERFYLSLYPSGFKKRKSGENLKIYPVWLSDSFGAFFFAISNFSR
jgi:hypothetical protein